MRPRPSCRGEPGTRASAALAASMRPRPSCRGERSTACVIEEQLRCLQCGHGLRAVENRMRTAWRTRLRRFNAATASCRGERQEAAALSRAITLQCGHGPCRGERAPETGVTIRGVSFNAATAFVPWRTSCVIRSTARTTRRFNAATASCRGERSEPTDGPEAVDASMRPRPSCRGEPAARRYDKPCREVASMRPRPSCRGEPAANCQAIRRRGSRFNAATASKAVENSARSWASAKPCASMRPRPGPWRTKASSSPWPGY